ncbi:MAG TPA: UDP-N-acetylglucosamine 2-epimerase (non-hydrolyzing) [Bdellovibrionota bacterium]|nr:UDP-N-acetylglucosamine 2-epimerase (non-hydrolyzing) [Bdellovibrionota bacterium]
MSVRKKRVAIVFGTRPEVIKLWPLIEALQKFPRIRTTTVNTGQHGFLSAQAARNLGVKWNVNLRVMEPDQRLSSVVARMVDKLDRLFARLAPGLVVVQGDTATALAAALAAYHLKIPVAHVEAGLRTGDRYQPFPEENYRVMVDHLATLHFAPTLHAKNALLREAIHGKHLYVTGNTVVDAVTRLVRRSPAPRWPKPYLLVTLHRRENFRGTIRNVARVLISVLREEPNLHVVWPVHPNPNVRRQIPKAIRRHSRVHLVEPLPYISFLGSAKGSTLILSDSGGIQEEAPTLKKRVILVRNVTERPEAVKAGWSSFVGTEEKALHRAILMNLHRRKVPSGPNPFGDGRSGTRIARLLAEYLKD